VGRRHPVQTKPFLRRNKSIQIGTAPFSSGARSLHPGGAAPWWSRDATVEIADELRRRYVECDELPARFSISWKRFGVELCIRTTVSGWLWRHESGT
jgi:hypothetical protein